MEVDGNHAVDAGGLEEFRDVGSGDGLGLLEFVVLAGIGIVGDDDGDGFSRGPAKCTDKKEELHEVVVDGLGDRLDEEDVAASDVVQNLEGKEFS